MRIINFNKKGENDSANFFKSKYEKIVDFIVIVICLVPILFFNFDYIETNDRIIRLLDFISNVFPSINSIAEVGKSAGVDLFIKVQISFSMIAIVIVFFFNFYKYGRLYLCSLGLIQYNQYYFNKKLSKNIVNTTVNNIFISFIIIFIFLDLYLFSFLSDYDFINYGIYTKVLFSTKIGAVITSWVFLHIFSQLAYLIVESISHIYMKIYKVECKL